MTASAPSASGSPSETMTSDVTTTPDSAAQ
jgi:hypothetical protein